MTDQVLVAHPRLVVLIPCYNEARFIGETIASVRAQTFRDFRVLISDNCSTDETPREIAHAVDGDERFTCIRQPENIGGSENFNFCRRASDSRYLMWLGGHDLIDPDYLERHMRALEANPAFSISYSDSAWIREDGSLIETTRGFMDRLPRSALLRYFLAVRSNDWMNEITNVIRRDALADFTFGKTYSPDIIGLSHLAYAGPMNRVTGIYYRRRVVEKRDHDYMQRLTGKADSRIDYNAFLDAYERQFLVTARRHPLRHAALAVARPWLRYRFGTKTDGPAAAFYRGLTRLKETVRRIY